MCARGISHERYGYTDVVFAPTTYCDSLLAPPTLLCLGNPASFSGSPTFCMYLLILIDVLLHTNYQCKICWNKALTFGVGSIQLSFRIYHCVHPIHANMFSIQILLHFSQISTLHLGFTCNTLEGGGGIFVRGSHCYLATNDCGGQ